MPGPCPFPNPTRRPGMDNLRVPGTSGLNMAAADALH